MTSRIVFAALAGFASCFAGCKAQSPTAEARVFVIGWDGGSQRVVDELLAKEQLPNLKKLIASGIYGPLTSMKPTLSPLLWTTVATGRLPPEHGITGFWLSKGAAVAPFRTTQRRAAPLWQIASRAGRQVDVVGYWSTWPAEDLNGTMVSDRYVFTLMQTVALALGHTLEGGSREVSRLVTPASDDTLLRSCLEASGAAEVAMFQRAKSVELPPRLRSGVLDTMHELVRQDGSVHCMAKRLLDRRVPHLLFLHQHGADILQHLAWKYRFPAEWKQLYGDEVPAAEIALFGDAIDEYYRILDARLGELMRYADASTTIIVMSDHGAHAGRTHEFPEWSGNHDDAPDGIFVAGGAGLKNGAALGRASLVDVAPSVLALLGLPVARDMRGKVLAHVLAAEVTSQVAFVDTYPNEVPPEVTDDSPMDAALVERLRALGYVSPDAVPATVR